jgi:hypothetical protein
MKLPKAFEPPLKRAKRKLQRGLSSRNPLPDWGAVLGADLERWVQARADSAGGTRVLIATSTGGHPAVTPLESVLAASLTLRGASVQFLLCDEFLPACLQASFADGPSPGAYAEHGPRMLCGDCYRAGHKAYEPLGLPINRFSELVSVDERAEAARVARELPLAHIAGYRLDGLAVGEHAQAGALRYFARGEIGDEPYGEPILRRYLEAALHTVYATRRLIERERFEVACFHHGIYVPLGLIGEVCRQEGVRVVNWVPAYRKRSFVFSHDDTYHHTLMSEPVSAWEDIEWTPELERDILDYLKSRWQGSRDWIYFHERPQEDLDKVSRELGLDFSKPTIGMLTNVIWDAQLHYPANAFANMVDWTLRTIEYFAGRPDLQLLIRVHPAELRGSVPSRQLLVDEIRRAFPQLPSNVYLVPPESQISTYVAMLACDSVIIYGTKTGVELSSLSVPIIVAGEAWIRGKGVTTDANSAEEYFQILDGLPLGSRMDEATTRRARMYAYHFFFRRMIPLAFVEPVTRSTLENALRWWPYTLRLDNGLDDLRAGHDLGLDTICAGILEGAPFIYPAEAFAAEALAQPARQ